MRVVILGAGLTGLSAAYHLDGEDYLILEKSDRAGGLCRTDKYDGFLFDRSVHVLYTRAEYAANLIQNILLKGNYHEQMRESWIRMKGRYTEYPFQINTYGLPPEVIKECILGLVKVINENRQPTNERGDAVQPGNFEDWIYRTFGDGIANHFMIPYNRKLWCMDLRRMNYDWIADRVPVPKLEDVLDGALKPPERKFGPNSTFWYPTQGGIEALPRGFLPYIGSRLLIDTEVVRIHSEKKFVETRNGKTIGYEKLIYTLPLPQVPILIDHVPAAVRRAAQRLEYNIVHTVKLGIDRPGISDFHWVYFPEDEFVFFRISYQMNFHKSCAPEGKSSIICDVSQGKCTQMDREALIRECIKDLKKAEILKKDDEILAAAVDTLNPAYVIYDLEHRQKVRLIHDFLRSRNIYPAGRFGEWEYLNMDHSILAGRKVSEKVRE